MYKLHYAETAPAYNDFFGAICQIGSLESEKDFNDFCKLIVSSWQGKVKTSLVYKEFDSIEKNLSSDKENSIITPWGGVYIVKHEHPLVEKYLLIKKGKYLSFEKHEEKDEYLEVKEGAGVLLQREGEFITVKILLPGFKAQFKPGEEHCIIATEDLLTYEKSFDYKGMDKDLIFIFAPEV